MNFTTLPLVSTLLSTLTLMPFSFDNENGAFHKGILSSASSSFPLKTKQFNSETENIDFCHLSGPESLEIVQNIRSEHLQNLEREEIIRIFTSYYIAEDRRAVQAVMGTLSSGNDFIDALAIVGSRLPSNTRLDIYDQVAALIALQWRQEHEMLMRIPRINGRLRLGGYEFLTQQEVRQIRERWPSISQLGNQLLAGSCSIDIVGEASSSSTENQAQVQSSIECPSESERQKTRSASVPFEVCGCHETWTRPTDSEQLAHLQSNRRFGRPDGVHIDYEAALNSPNFRNSFLLFSSWLELRLADIPEFTGLWSLPRQTVPSELSDFCGSFWDRSSDNLMVRAFLFSHEIQSIQWTGSSYTMTVVSANAGFQDVFFERVNAQSNFLVYIVDENGSEITSCTPVDRNESSSRVICGR